MFSALVLVDITPRVDMSGVAKVLGFMRANAKEGFASIAKAAQAVAEYLPQRPRPKSHEDLKKNLRLSPDGRWRRGRDLMPGHARPEKGSLFTGRFSKPQ